MRHDWPYQHILCATVFQCMYYTFKCKIWCHTSYGFECWINLLQTVKFWATVLASPNLFLPPWGNIGGFGELTVVKYWHIGRIMKWVNDFIIHTMEVQKAVFSNLKYIKLQGFYKEWKNYTYICYNIMCSYYFMCATLYILLLLL